MYRTLILLFFLPILHKVYNSQQLILHILIHVNICFNFQCPQHYNSVTILSYQLIANKVSNKNSQVIPEQKIFMISVSKGGSEAEMRLAESLYTFGKNWFFASLFLIFKNCFFVSLLLVFKIFVCLHFFKKIYSVV